MKKVSLENSMFQKLNGFWWIRGESAADPRTLKSERRNSKAQFYKSGIEAEKREDQLDINKMFDLGDIEEPEPESVP